jgi:serine/threonine protein kinase
MLRQRSLRDQPERRVGPRVDCASMSTSTSTQRPERVGDYLVLGTLSEGPTTVVSTALRVGDDTGTLFALKRPRLGQRPSGRAAQAIVREAEVLRALGERERGAPGFARLDRSGSLAGLPFLATELASGASLDRVLAGGKLDKGARASLVAALAAALSRLHEVGFVHGDVCPRNVLVTDEGDVVLLDLGLAARVGEERDAAVGTAGYVPPEGARPTRADPSHDVYSLAVVLAEAHLGRRLFPERELAEAASREAPARDALPRSPLGDWLERALARDPRARPTLGELAALVVQGDGAARDAAALAERARLAALGEPAPAPAGEGERDTVYDPALAGGVTSAEGPSPLALVAPGASQKTLLEPALGRAASQGRRAAVA